MACFLNVMDEKIKFVGQILDNVHSFIPYTAAEKKIIDTQLFKRLQSIKQLSVVNWVFPGSEHTRFIHSLGVMHIADKMAASLGLPDEERKILRLAGLLHDIGHYPLSHVCEAPYRSPMTLEELPDSEFCCYLNKNVREKINSFAIEPKTTLMSKSTGRHHEAIGALTVRSNEEIRKIIIDECGYDYAPDVIADIIIGNVERAETDPLLVQIIHSELDADGIDYLMRDAMFSGTSFGSFEIDQLIHCLTYGEQDGKRILCITPKGIAAADQYLINKFFSYSQVVFNKHITISEWMAECVIDWMQKHHAVFPSGAKLEEWIKNGSAEYLNFTDNMFWSALDQILKNQLCDLVPHYIKVFCKNLLLHNEPVFVENSEVRFIESETMKARSILKESDVYTKDELLDKRITILNNRCMTKQVPIDIFNSELSKINESEDDRTLSDDDIANAKLSRLMECISIKEKDGSMHLLCDDRRSLMQTMYNSTLVMMRSYEFPTDTLI